MKFFLPKDFPANKDAEHPFGLTSTTAAQFANDKYDRMYPPEVRATPGVEREFQLFMQRTKNHLAQVIRDELEDALATCYTDYAHHIESDAWTNYREELRRELGGGLYKSVADTEEGTWARNMRTMILHEHKDQLVAALNQDLLEEIKQLKQDISHLYNRRF